MFSTLLWNFAVNSLIHSPMSSRLQVFMLSCFPFRFPSSLLPLPSIEYLHTDYSSLLIDTLTQSHWSFCTLSIYCTSRKVTFEIIAKDPEAKVLVRVLVNCLQCDSITLHCINSHLFSKSGPVLSGPSHRSLVHSVVLLSLGKLMLISSALIQVLCCQATAKHSLHLISLRIKTCGCSLSSLFMKRFYDFLTIAWSSSWKNRLQKATQFLNCLPVPVILLISLDQSAELNRWVLKYLTSHLTFENCVL